MLTCDIGVNNELILEFTFQFLNLCIGVPLFNTIFRQFIYTTTTLINPLIKILWLTFKSLNFSNFLFSIRTITHFFQRFFSIHLLTLLVFMHWWSLFVVSQNLLDRTWRFLFCTTGINILIRGDNPIII